LYIVGFLQKTESWETMSHSLFVRVAFLLKQEGATPAESMRSSCPHLVRIDAHYRLEMTE